MATIRQARAAIVKGAEPTGWPRPEGSDVAETMRGLGRLLRGPQRQAAPLSAEALAAVRATAFTRRRTRGGHTETAEYAQRRGLVDVALAYVMRDGLLRVSEAAAPTYLYFGYHAPRSCFAPLRSPFAVLNRR